MSSFAAVTLRAAYKRAYDEFVASLKAGTSSIGLWTPDKPLEFSDDAIQRSAGEIFWCVVPLYVLLLNIKTPMEALGASDFLLDLWLTLDTTSRAFNTGRPEGDTAVMYRHLFANAFRNMLMQHIPDAGDQILYRCRKYRNQRMSNAAMMNAITSDVNTEIMVWKLFPKEVRFWDAHFCPEDLYQKGPDMTALRVLKQAGILLSGGYHNAETYLAAMDSMRGEDGYTDRMREAHENIISAEKAAMRTYQTKWAAEQQPLGRQLAYF
jgi:hypothetical protein